MTQIEKDDQVAVLLKHHSTHFQLIMNIETNLAYGVEALARFPQFSPQEVIAQAKRGGWYEELELALLERAMEHAELLPPGVICTVNISASTVMHAKVHELMRAHASRTWGFEILEFSRRLSCVEAFHQCVRDFGCDLLIDDAGSGNSDPYRIRGLRPTIVKIDRGLLLHASHSQWEHHRLETIVNEAHEAGALLLAEGIETAGQLAFARAVGCTYAQGFYFGVPCPIADITRQLTELTR